MTSQRILALRRLVWAPMALALLAGGCSDSDDSNKGLSESGFCADTCPKVCSEDTDCDTASGELCCDFGGEGTACVKAASCPRFCQSDSECDTAGGEVCVRVTLESAKKICTQPEKAITTCSGDSDCDTAGGEVCCQGVYSQSICQQASICPSTCGQSSDCDTGAGETCCTTYPQLFPTITSSICIDPSFTFCPKACQKSEDCDTAAGELCCDGLCAESCEKSCTASDQCTGQLCCLAKAAQSIWYTIGASNGSGGGGGGGGGGKGGGSDICDQAVQKLTTCGSDIETIGECTAIAACAAQCIMDASCSEIQQTAGSFTECVDSCAY